MGMRILCGGKLSAVVCAFALSACAGRDPHPVAVVQPQDAQSDCAMVRAEIEANNVQAEKLAEENHAKIAQNVAAGVVGVVVWPVWFARMRKARLERKWMRSNPVSSISPHSRAAMRATDRSPATSSPAAATALEHDPEKWNPVCRKDHAQTKC
jgi:hypothetical protein